MNIPRFPAIFLAVLLQFVPVVRVVLAQTCLEAPSVVALLRILTGATAVAGSLHAVSGASVTVLAPAGGVVRATNGVASPFRIDVNYFDGSTTHIASIYDATNLPPGFNQPTKSGAIWRITGTPTQSGVFSDVKVTAYDDVNKEGTNKATVTLVITVVDAMPTISSHPAGFSATEGDFRDLGVVAAGGSLRYQWLRNDLEVPDQTNSVLKFEALRMEDAGTYRVEVANGAGTVLSDPAEVTVVPRLVAPVFTLVPQSITVHQGEAFLLTSAATSEGPVSYSWTRNEEPLGTVTTGDLPFAAAAPSDAGRYVVTATGGGGTTPSPVAVVTVVAPLVLAIPVQDAGIVRLPFNGIPGRTYLLESATDLVRPVWEAGGEMVAAGDSAFSVPESGPNLRWFRVRTR